MKVLTNKTISSFINKLSNKSISSKDALAQIEIAHAFIKWLASVERISESDSIRFRSELYKSRGYFTSPKAPRLPFPVKYVGFSLALLSLILIGTGIYLRFYKNTKTPFAYSTAPVQAGRIISFQGRLTDTLGNPINAPIDITYNFYTVPTGGTTITGSTRVCTASPDQDGVFNSLIGNDTGPSCNTEIPSSIFTENTDVYLGVKIGSEITEMSPRQQIANVGYAINSETLQGMPPGQGVSNVPFINKDGNLLIAASNPGLRSTYASSNFTISSAQATTIQSAGSGDITLSATEGGSLRFNTYNGTLVERMTVLNTGRVGIGITAPRALLDVNGDATVSGSLIAGGQIKIGEFTVPPTNLGNGSLYYDSNTNKVYFWNGSGWADMGSGATQYFQRTLGSLAPTNITDDLNIGAVATGSAIVHLPGLTNSNAFFNLGTGKLGVGDTTPLSLFTVGTGDLFQIDSTGRIVNIDGVAHAIDDVSGNLTLTSNSNTISLNDNVSFTGTTTLNGLTYTWPGSQTTNYLLQTNGTGTLTWIDPNTIASGNIPWLQGAGILFPKNSTVDAFIGGQASSSAKFAFLNVNAGTPTASISGTTANVKTFLTGNGNLATTNMSPLTLGGASTGSIQLSPKGTTGLFVDGTGNVGVGTTSPGYKLDVNGNTKIGTNLGIGTSPNTTRSINALVTNTDAASDTSGNSFDSNFNVTTNNANIATGTQIVVSTSPTANNQGYISGLGVNANGNATGGTTLRLLGISGQAVLGSTAAYTEAGGLNYLLQHFGTGTVTTAYGANLSSVLRSSGTGVGGNITNAYGLSAGISNVNTEATPGVISNGIALYANAPAGTGLITSNYGIRAANQGRSGITNAYGLYLDNQTGATTNNYSIYSVGGDNYFGGNLGIGTTAPGSILELQKNTTGAVGPDLYLVNTFHTANSGSEISFRNNNSIDSAIITNAYIKEVHVGSGNQAGLQFGTRNTADTLATRLTIDKEGNVGIGIISPTAKLDVNGNLNVSTYATVSASLALGTSSSAAGPGNLSMSGNLLTSGNVTFSSLPTGIVHSTSGLLSSSAINLASSDVSGLLSSTNGGTGANNSAAAQYSVPYYSATGVLGGVLTPGTIGYVLSTNGPGGVPSWISSSGVGTNYWNITNGAIYPTNSTLDAFIGGTASASAKFAFLNSNSGTPTASISGSLANVRTYLTGDGNLATTNMAALTLGGASTGSIQLSPKGTAGLFVDGTGNVGVGTITPSYKLSVSGDINLTGAIRANGATGSSGFLLTSSAGGVNTWTDPSSFTGINYWNISNGAIFPVNATLDAFIGGTASASAKFAFLNSNSGTPTASISGSLANVRIFMDGNGNISTTNRQTLTLGNSSSYNSTGNILLNPNGTSNVGIGLTSPTYKLDVSGDINLTGAIRANGAAGTSGYVLTSSAGGVNTWTDPTSLVGGSNLWTLANGTIYPVNTTLDLLVGGTASSSAKFAFMNSNSGTPTASIAGSLANVRTYLTGNGNLATTNMAALTLGGASTGSIQLSPKGTTGLFVDGTGNVGVGTITPAGKLDVTDTSNTLASLSLTNNTATTIGAGVNTLGILDLQSTSLTTGNLLNVEINGLTSGKGFNLTSTSTGLTTGNLLSLDWIPGSATVATGDLFTLNIGANGTVGNLFNIKDAGSSLFSVSETAVTSNLPTAFTSAGDVSIAYDLNFTNPTASYIKSTAPLYIQAGETFGSSNLTLQAYNSGDVVIDSPGGVTLNQVQAWDLADSSITSLNIESGLLDFDTTNSRIGVGTLTPGYKLDVSGDINLTGAIRANGAAGTSGYVLTSSAGGVNTWTDPTSLVGGSNLWTLANGTIYPVNTTLDLLVGGTASSSAKFAFMNSNSGTPTASIAGSLANVRTYLTGNGNLATTNMAALTLGGASTGSIQLSPKGTTGLFVDGTGNVGVGTVTPIYKFQVHEPSSQADIAISTNVNLGSANTTQLSFTSDLDGTPSISSIGQFNTADLRFSSIGNLVSPDMLIKASTGNVGIANTNPLEKLDVTGNASVSGYLTLGQSGALRSQYGPLNLAYKSGLNSWLTGLVLQDTTGNVGIGNLNPTQKLTLQQNSNADIFGAYDGASGSANLLLANAGVLTLKPTSFIKVYTCTANANCTAAGADGGTFTDNTTESKTNAGTPYSLFATGTAANTSFYVGLDHPFSTINVDIVTADIGTTALTAQFWNGTAWTNVTGQVDGTSQLTVDGTITYTLPTTWATKVMNGIVPLYWIRVKGTTNASTAPTANFTTPTTGNRFMAYGQSGDALSSLYLNDNGNVGIGTNTPTSGYKLHVAGNILADALYDTGNPTYFINPAGDSSLGGNVTAVGDFTGINATMSGNITVGNNGALRSQYGALNFAYKQFQNTWTTGMVLEDITGNVGIGRIDPTAFLGLAAATTAKASLNLQTSGGVNPSTPISGDVWWNGTNLNFYDGSATTDILAGAIGGLLWTDGTTYVYPTGAKPIGNLNSGGANKLSGLYLADSAPITFGNTNDTSFSFASGVLSTTLGNNAWNIASNLLYLKGSTNQIGIGTIDPLATLDIRALSGTTPVASISGNTSMASLVVDQTGNGDIFTASDSGQTRFVITKNGNVGIGVSNPTSRLSVAGSSSTISNSSGDITLDSFSNNISFSNDNLINVGNIASIGQIQFGGFAGPPTAIGNGASYFDTLTNKIFYWDGSAWSEMGSKYWQRTLGSLAPSNITDDLNIGAIATGSAIVHLPGLTNQDAWFNLGTKSLGVGTTSPITTYGSATIKFHVNGNVLANAYYDTANSNYYINPASDSNLGGGVTMAGDLFMTDGTPLISSYDGAGYSVITLRGSGDTTNPSVCIDEGGTPGSCSGKLDAGTIDPPYTINGEKYATFLPAMTGVKEETTGKVLITEKNEAAHAYIKRIELGNQTEGSDLWLFSKVTNLKDQAKDLMVLLSSTTNGKVWYTMNPTDLVLTLYSTTPTEISYRLTAPRFDSYKWSNARGEGELASGFAIDDRGNIAGGVSPTYSAPQLSYQNNIYSLVGTFIEEFASANKALFAQITTGILNAQKIVSPLAEIETLQITNKITSPIIESELLKASNKIESPVIKTEEIQPSNNSLSINLAANSGQLAALVIKGLNSTPVVQIDALGNATFSGELTAESLTSENASISGTLIAKTIQSETIDSLESNVSSLSSTLASSNSQFATDINTIQQELASIQSQPLPNPAYYQNIDATYDNVTINETANIYKAHIADSLVVGSLFIEPTSILALSSDLRISSLGTIRLFDDVVVIAKNGNITTKGQVVAESLAIKNSEGVTVASIDASGSARFNEVIANKFTLDTIATQGALIADSGILNEENVPIPAIKTAKEIAGTGVLPIDTKEVIIYNDNVTSNSLIYLTPTTDNIQGQLSVAKKVTCMTDVTNITPTCTPYFIVSSNSYIHSASAFNWLIIN